MLNRYSCLRLDASPFHALNYLGTNDQKHDQNVTEADRLGSHKQENPNQVMFGACQLDRVFDT